MHLLLTLLPQKGLVKTFVSLFCLLLTANAFATDYYVALPPLGNDTNNNGLSDATPFATIGKAAAVAGAGDRVLVLPGTYREQVEIKKDGATFMPRDGKGTVTINGTDLMLAWTPASGSTYKTTMSWNVESKWGTNQLFQDGRMIELARWPKQTSSDIVMPTNAKMDTAYAGSEANTIVFVDSDFNEPAERWIGAKVWVNLAHKGLDGQGRTGRVVAINGNAITVIGGNGSGIGNLGRTVWGIERDTEYFLFDPAPAALPTDADVDAVLAPGEWWKNGNNLYVKTRNGGAPAAEATATGNRIEAKRRHFGFWPEVGNHSAYTIKDFDLFACAISTDRSFTSNRIMETAHDITLSGLTFKYVSHQTVMQGDYQAEHYGFTGIVLSGRNNTLEDSDIMYSATSAVSFIGANNKLLRNQIHETNYMCSNSGAVNTGAISVDSEIGYNTIWNTTMMGVNMKAFKGSDPEVKHTARIHHNTIYDFMLRSFDSSALDVVGEDLRWVRIDHNRIYNTRPEARIGTRKYGIYLDYGGGVGANANRIRATVDHNVVWDVNNPMTLNTGWDVHVFNNVFMAVAEQIDHPLERSTALTITLKLSEAPKAGTNIRVYNNILNEAIYLSQGPNPFISILNNITNATGSVLSGLFVDATSPMVPGTASARDYRLKATATAAIDKGISVDEYTTNYPLDRPVVGLTDIGAFEHPTSTVSADTQAPSVPQSSTFVVANKTGNSFLLSWTPSTDDIAGVAYYEVYANGALVKQTSEASLQLTKLEGSTSYFIKILAVDASGNRSALSDALEVKTTAPVVDADIAKTTATITIDGTKEAAWSSPMLPIAIINGSGGTGSDSQFAGPADLSGSWTSLWDDNNLYFFIDANDDVKRVDDPAANGKEWYFDDHIEILIDPTGNRIGAPRQYFMVRGKLFYKSEWNPTAGAVLGVEVPGAQASLVEKADGSGYRVEVKLPFSALGITAAALDVIGLDVQIGDDDDGGVEDTRLSWITTDGGASGNASVLGLAKLTAEGIPDDTENPSAPTNLVADYVLSNELKISWTASIDNGAISNYEVYVNGNLVGTPRLTNFTVRDLTEGATYSVQVKAKDRFSNLSGLSSTLKLTTPSRATATIYQTEDVATFAGAATKIFSNTPGVVSGYTGTGYGKLTHDGSSAISFTITVPTAGTYAAFYRYSTDQNSRISFFVNGVKMGGDVQDYGTKVGAQRLAFLNKGSYNNWDDLPLLLTLNAGTNTVELRSVSSSDNRGEVYLDYLAVYPFVDSQGPGVPTNLNVTNTTATGFTLSWTGSADNSGVAPSYQVYRNGTLAGTTANTTFNVTSLTPGTYVMTVKAIDAAGSQSDASSAIEVDIVGGAPSAGNNPGFENNFTSWSTYGGASISTTPANVRSGARSGFFSNGGGNYVINGLTPGATYKVRAWVKAVSGTDIWIVVTNYGGAQVGARMTSPTWTQSGDIVFTMGANNTSVTLAAWTGNGSSAYFDDYTIERNSSGVPVRGVTVTPATATIINLGATRQLNATTIPINSANNTLAWSSSNTAVATVSSTGLVTSVGFGTATITATSTDGSNKSASSAITVSRDWTKVDSRQANSGITYDANWGNFNESRAYAGTLHGSRNEDQLPEATFTFTGGRVRFYGVTRYNLGILDVYLDGVKVATVDQYGNNGEEVYDKLLWDSGEIASGAHTVKIKATNTTNLTAPNRLERHKLTNILIDAFEFSTYSPCTTCRTANAEVASQAKAEAFTLKLHPNPASQEVSIDLSGFIGESAVQVKMSDMSGKLFLGQQVQLGEGINKVSLPVSHLPQGLFFVTVQGSKATKTAKLVITK